MAKPELKSLFAINLDLEAWAPANRADVCVNVELNIGERGRIGSDIYSILVVTPEGLRRYRDGPVLCRRATYVVSDWDFSRIRKFAHDLVSSVRASNWHDASMELMRYLNWEFDDYRSAHPEHALPPPEDPVEAHASKWDAGDLHLPSWHPAEPEEVYVPLTFRVTDQHSKRNQRFSVLVATPEGLREHGQPPVIAERATLVLDAFDWQIVRSEVQRTVTQCNAGRWLETVDRLQRFYRLARDD